RARRGRPAGRCRRRLARRPERRPHRRPHRGRRARRGAQGGEPRRRARRPLHGGARARRALAAFFRTRPALPRLLPPFRTRGRTQMAGSVIIAGARTPIGKLSGALAGFSAAELGSFAIKAALERAGVAPDQVDYVFMGHVIQAGTGQITARQAAVRAGIPMTVPATTVNKVCLSGLNAIYLADQMIQAGDAQIGVAGGMDSMTQAPYLLPGARECYRYGDGTLVDSCAHDALFCSFDKMAMGGATEKYAASAGVASEPQDEFAAKSHERAAAAIKDGKFADEIVPVEIPQRKGDPVLFDTDEGVRPGTTVEALASLRPAFDKAGNITAGNASQISDGASAVIVASKAKADELGVTPLGEIVGYGQIAGPDPSLLTQPARA